MTSEVKTFISLDEIGNDYDPSKNVSSPIMTVYEKTNVIGLRLEQLSFGSKSMLSDEDYAKCNSLRDVVDSELKQKLIPYMIQRNISHHSKEFWKVKDMIIL